MYTCTCAIWGGGGSDDAEVLCHYSGGLYNYAYRVGGGGGGGGGGGDTKVLCHRGEAPPQVVKRYI